MQSLQWYVNRLGRMSPGELAYRLGQLARSTSERWLNGASSEVPPPQGRVAHAQFVHVPHGIDVGPYVERAERIIAGRFSFFTLKDCFLGHPPQWNRDPLTGRTAPLAHASALDYRDERLVGNIKFLWEPNRHLHIPALAQAYALTRDERFAHALQVQLDSWMKQCPVGRGANWCSSLELAIRLINWSIAWQLLGGYESGVWATPAAAQFREQWIASVYQHTRAIMRKLSKYSSANNHLIGEVAGVWIASVTWNYWPEMRRWGARAKHILMDQALLQNAPDGGNREQAFSYQQFVLDFLLLAGLAGRAAQQDFSAAYWHRLERMMEFIAAMLDAGGHMPMVGDADDGYVVQLTPQSPAYASGGSGRAAFDNYRSLLATGALVFERADFAQKAGGIDDKSRWLFAPERIESVAQTRSGTADVQLPRAFPDSGYYILGSQLGTSDEIRMLLDAGPLGYLSIAAHGHADALNLLLSVGGEEVLIDPGTYAYHTEPEWRTYFRSTRAHNTVMVDGHDQSRQSGNFMWSQHANARCLQFDIHSQPQRFCAEHDGYTVLEDPLIHRREVIFDEALKRFEIVDSFECAAEHEVVRHWHFAEHLQVRAEGAEIATETASHRVRIVAQEADVTAALITAGSAAEGGWVSRSFGEKVPAATARWTSKIRGPTSLRTHIYIEPKVAAA